MSHVSVRALIAVGVVAGVLLAPYAGGPPAAAADAPSTQRAKAAAVRWLLARTAADGGFREPGAAPTPGLTAWAVLGLRAAGVPASRLTAAGAYLIRAEQGVSSPTDLQLLLLARRSLGHGSADLVARVRALGRGPTVNSAIWAVLALRAAGEPPPAGAVTYLLRRQTRAGGWSWAERGSADSNDTAAAVQALRAAGVSGAPIRRALAFLGRHRRADGGYELTRRRGSDVQSTAWAVQAYLAAGRAPPAPALRYLLRLQRRDGSFRYSARYAVTPTWVTAQALLALARKPLPLRSATSTDRAPPRA
jgi:hypothetical protein